MNWVAWRAGMSRLAAQFGAGFEPTFGYPPDDHTVGGPTPPEDLQALAANATVDVPAPLVEFYENVAEVSLPDVDNGYFIHPASRVTQGLRPGRAGGDVIEVDHEAVRAPVMQIGSDGGGGLYALERTPEGRVFYLPVGELRDGVYLGNSVDPPRVAALSLEDLLVGWERRMRNMVSEMTAPTP